MFKICPESAQVEIDVDNSGWKIRLDDGSSHELPEVGGSFVRVTRVGKKVSFKATLSNSRDNFSWIIPLDETQAAGVSRSTRPPASSLKQYVWDLQVAGNGSL